MGNIAIKVLQAARALATKQGWSAAVRWLRGKGVRIGIAMSEGLVGLGFRRGGVIVANLLLRSKAGRVAVAQAYKANPKLWDPVWQTAAVALRPSVAKVSGVINKRRQFFLAVLGYVTVDALIEGTFAIFEMAKEKGQEAQLEQLREILFAQVIIEIEDMVEEGEGNQTFLKNALALLAQGQFEEMLENENPTLMVAIDRAAEELGLTENFTIAVANNDEVSEVADAVGKSEEEVSDLIRTVENATGFELQNSSSPALLASTLNKDDLVYDYAELTDTLERAYRQKLGEFFRVLGGPETAAAIRDVVLMTGSEFMNAVSTYFGPKHASRLAAKS